jgi:hypothetical protein
MEKKCKECGVVKDLDLFYWHPLTKDRRQGRCIECILAGRKTEHELSLARKRDYKRYHTNKERRAFHTRNVVNFRKKYPEKYSATLLVRYYFKRKGSIERPKKSWISGLGGIIHLHHHDYSKPNEVIPCTPLEHRAMHKGSIKIKPEYILKLDF